MTNSRPPGVATSLDHPLAARLNEAAQGRFPAVDGVAEIVPPDPWGACAVVEFTGHAMVLTGHSPADLERFAPDGYGAATDPAFLLYLAGPGGQVGCVDAVLMTFGGGGRIDLPTTSDFDDHPRVVRARHHRRDVTVYGDERGLVCVGSGLVGRTEISLELSAAEHGAGVGRALVAAVLAGLPADRPVFAQIAPGNAASLRMFLALGFVPIGAEALIEPAR